MEIGEIKYRAWDKFNAQYWYSEKYENLGRFFIGMQMFIDADNGLIFEQYTGLNRNGNKVYDGDILKVAVKYGFNSELLNEFKELNNLESINGIGLHFTGIVRIDFFRGLMFENPKNGYREPIFDRFIKETISIGDFEVIGNIHENPELLKP